MLIDGKHLEDYRFFQELIANPLVEAVYLYGSWARGDNRTNSDIDLGVVCNGATDEQWVELRKTVTDNNELLLKVDIARLDTNKDIPFLNQIIRDRKLLYLKETFAKHRWSLSYKLEFITSWNDKMLGWANYLEEQLSSAKTPSDELMQKALQSFHSGFSCAWVLYRKCLALHGLNTNNPLTTLREAITEGWITDRAVWEAMVEDYYETRYDSTEEKRRRVYENLPQYVCALREACDTMKHLIKPYEHAH